ncbi:MAG: nucleotidyl transferase AbiEii/AbiGii toxin family protein [Atribacterota bacterium]
MKKEIKEVAASTRARLFNIAKLENIDFDFLLLRYFQERFLYRLSISNYSKNFILKGGLLLVYLDIPKSRPTVDIDFLARKIKSNSEDVKNVICQIAEIYCNDGVKFYPDSAIAEIIKKNTDYTGIRIKINASLEQAKKSLKFDISFGDIVIPKAIRKEFPTLLDESSPQILVYSIESIVAEKFEAMVKLAMINSRMKDFYDVYMLSNSQNFKSNTLKKAIELTFLKRDTIIPDNPMIFKSEFHNNKEKQQQWLAFIRKTKIEKVTSNFNEVMERITKLLKPIAIAIQDKVSEEKIWDPIGGFWR